MLTNDWSTAVAVVRLASQVVDGIQSGLVEQGFDDVRPAHGFAFALLSGGPVTTAELVDHSYLTRGPDPRDGRAKLLELTDRGRACTRAAERAAVDTIEGWRNELTAQQFARFQEALAAVALPGRLRPAW